MNENIDLTKILKNCPKDAIFYSSMYGNVIVRIFETEDFPIAIYKYSVNGTFFLCRLSKEGKYSKQYNAECTLFPSKEQRDWSKFTAPWYKKEKFDPKTLKPFDRVIVREKYGEWFCTIFSNIKEGKYPYNTATGCYGQCIPYNDDTKHLIGTINEAPEFYRYWED